MDVPTQRQTNMQRILGNRIAGSLAATPHNQCDVNYYIIKTNGDRIPSSNEASGFKKLGFLGLLIACGQIAPDAALFWDEPENSLNPELVPILADVLLLLFQNGVQIFIATHSDFL
jgi:predicted ATPase